MTTGELPKNPHNLIAGLSKLVKLQDDYSAACCELVAAGDKGEAKKADNLRVRVESAGLHLLLATTIIGDLLKEAKGCVAYLYGYVPASLLPEFRPQVTHPCA